MRKNRFLDAGCHKNLRGSVRGARTDNVQAESLSCCSTELVGFVRPGELTGFVQRQATRPPPVGNVFGLRGIT